MRVRYNMVVDFARPTKSNTILISEGDTNSRMMHFTLLFDKQAFDMTDVTSVIVKGITSAGQTLFDSSATICEDDSGNKLNEIEYVIPSDLSTLTGTLTVTVSLSSLNGETITSFECYIKIRNALYNEDDVASEEDMAGFRELLQKTQYYIAQIENMVQQNALPNPKSLTIEVDGVTYEYLGDEPVIIDMGDVAYIGQDIGAMENTADDSSAYKAAQSEANAKASEDAAALSEANVSAMESALNTKMADIDSKVTQATKAATDSEYYFNNINQLSPRASVSKSGTTSTLTVTDVHGSTSVDIHDGVDGQDGADGTDGESLTASSNKVGKVTTVTISNASTGAVVDTFTIQDGADGSGGGGDMRQAVYDTDGSGIVDAAESISSGSITLTAQQIKNKISEPATDGTNGQVLTTDGNGGRSWATVSSGVSSYNSLTDKPFDTLGTDFLKDTIDGNKLKLATSVTSKLSALTVPQSTDNGKVLTANNDGTTKWEVAKGGHDMTADIDEILTVTKAENKVVNAFDIADWSNVYTECIGAVLTSGKSTIGTWFEDGETWDLSKMGFQHDSLKEASNEQLHFEFDFWVGNAIGTNIKANTTPLHITGYQWDSTDGYMTIRCQEEAPNDITVIVKVTHIRER